MAYTLEFFNIKTYCLQCGREIRYGRADRKFCCADCKNRYHNRRRYPFKGDVQIAVLQKIELNYDVLDRLYKMGVFTIDVMALSQMGFDNRFVTTFRRLGRRNVFTIFDYQFEMTQTRMSKLVRLNVGKA